MGRCLVRFILALAFVVPYHVSAAPEETETFKLKGAFHMAGLPGVPRNGRLDLTFTTEGLVFEGRGPKFLFSVPYQSIRRVQLCSGERRYSKTAFAAALATQLSGLDPAGGLLILKKTQVHKLLVEYVNQRGGAMEVVLQIPLQDWGRCTRRLETYGIQVEEPAPAPATTPERK